MIISLTNYVLIVNSTHLNIPLFSALRFMKATGGGDPGVPKTTLSLSERFH